MPLYGIKCDVCGHEDEMIRSVAQFDQLPMHCGKLMHRVLSAPRVMSDIEPYQAMAADKETGKRPMITSRSQHREFLYKNGYFEIGNEKPKPAPQPQSDKNEIGRQIKQIIDQKGIRA